MKINGWDISEAMAKQWNVTMGHHSVNSDSEWVRGSPIPVMCKNKIGFKSIKVTMLVYGSSRDDIIRNRSIVLSHLLVPVDLEMDGFSHKFHGIMTKCTQEEKVMRRWHKLTVELNGYEYEDKEPSNFSGSTTILFYNSGNILTPVIAEITPQIGATSITLTGICRDTETGDDIPVIIKSPVKGEKIVLDGENGIFTINGAASDNIEIWELPTILPGENKITIDNNWVDLKLSFRPRFM